jgi:hypothetical protein
MRHFSTSQRKQYALWRSKLSHILSRGAWTVPVGRAHVITVSCFVRKRTKRTFADMRAAIYSYELPSSSSPEAHD